MELLDNLVGSSFWPRYELADPRRVAVLANEYNVITSVLSYWSTKVPQWGYFLLLVSPNFLPTYIEH